MTGATPLAASQWNGFFVPSTSPHDVCFVGDKFETRGISRLIGFMPLATEMATWTLAGDVIGEPTGFDAAWTFGQVLADTESDVRTTFSSAPGALLYVSAGIDGDCRSPDGGVRDWSACGIRQGGYVAPYFSGKRVDGDIGLDAVSIVPSEPCYTVDSGVDVGVDAGIDAGGLPDGATDAVTDGTDSDPGSKQVVGYSFTGGGGCACAVSRPNRARTDWLAALLALGGVAIAVRRRCRFARVLIAADA